MMRRVKVGLATLVVLLAVTASAYGAVRTSFPALRLGSGNEPTAGGGVVAGDRYVARSAVVVWNRKWSNLTLYLFWRHGVDCGNLKRALTRPGHLIQIFVTHKPDVTIGLRLTDAQVTFETTYKDPNVPMSIAGLKHGAQLTFTRVDSHPHGVWHGRFTVPHRAYGDGKVYGYNGTFAANWCQVRR
jgi:hypothetical protein